MSTITITITIPAPMPSDHKTIEAQDIHFHLAETLNKKWFNITGLTNIAKSHGHRWYDHPARIQAFHCVHWNEMTAQQQQRLIDYTLGMAAELSGHQIVVE